VVVAILLVFGLYEFRSGGSSTDRDQNVKELRAKALALDASARERMQELKSGVVGGGAAHLQPENGDQHPALRIAEGGIPDGYFPIDLNTHMENPKVQLCRLDIAVSALRCVALRSPLQTAVRPHHQPPCTHHRKCQCHVCSATRAPLVGVWLVAGVPARPVADADVQGPAETVALRWRDSAGETPLRPKGNARGA